MVIILSFIFTFLIAILHSWEELEIEGKTKHGWARCLPTKRINNKLTQFLVGKELTMYHIYMMIRIFCFYHFIFIYIPWSIQAEALILSCISFYFVIEDISWFVCNPHYRLKNFNKKSISWHRRWFFGLPLSYIGGIIIGTLLLILAKIFD
jgi:hypothetical protein